MISPRQKKGDSKADVRSVFVFQVLLRSRQHIVIFNFYYFWGLCGWNHEKQGNQLTMTSWHPPSHKLGFRAVGRRQDKVKRSLEYFLGGRWRWNQAVEMEQSWWGTNKCKDSWYQCKDTVCVWTCGDAANILTCHHLNPTLNCLCWDISDSELAPLLSTVIHHLRHKWLDPFSVALCCFKEIFCGINILWQLKVNRRCRCFND